MAPVSTLTVAGSAGEQSTWDTAYALPWVMGGSPDVPHCIGERATVGPEAYLAVLCDWAIL